MEKGVLTSMAALQASSKGSILKGATGYQLLIPLPRGQK